MSSTVYLHASGRAFKKALTLLCTDSLAFGRGPFGQPKALQRFLGDRYADLAQDRRKSDELAVLGLKSLVLRLIAKAIDDSDLHLAEGLIMLWHRYLEAIGSGSARQVAPVGNVLRYSAKPDHRQVIAEAVCSEVPLTHRQAKEVSGAIRDLFLDLRGKDPGEKLTRTYANYLYRALETVAHEPELDGLLEVEPPAANLEDEVELSDDGAEEPGVRVSEAAVAEASWSEPPRPDLLEPLVAYIKQQCAQAPAACGLSLPITQAIPRRLSICTIRGTPALLDAGWPQAHGTPLTSVVLAGTPGSGRTTWLKCLAFDWACAWLPGAPLAVYVRAGEFLPFARNRRSVCAFTARKVYPHVGAGRVERADLIQSLEQLDEDGRVLWLVDDLDRLPAADQAEVLGQLALAPSVIVATAPWEAEQTVEAMSQPHLALATLEDLTAADQEYLALRLLAENNPDAVKLPRIRWALAEVPHLVRRPLGVAAVAAQVAACASHRVAIVRRALAELFERAGLPALTWSSDWSSQSPLTRGLLGLARASAMQHLESMEPVGLSQERVRQIVEPDTWADVERSRLLQPGVDGRHRFVEPDVLACLAALADPKRANWALNRPGCFAPDLAERLDDYLSAMWELAGH